MSHSHVQLSIKQMFTYSLFLLSPVLSPLSYQFLGDALLRGLGGLSRGVAEPWDEALLLGLDSTRASSPERAESLLDGARGTALLPGGLSDTSLVLPRRCCLLIRLLLSLTVLSLSISLS